jgi:protein PhnA
MIEALKARAGAQCELCSGGEELAAHNVNPGPPSGVDESVLLCGACRAAVASGAALTDARWYCLKESIWSEAAPVQVLTYRLLKSRTDHAPWAVDLLDQAYLADEVLSWAERGLKAENTLEVRDSNGSRLSDGDAVTLIRDLPVKGANFTAKRGTLVKSIRLGEDPTHVEGRVNKVSIMLKTCFLKRVG